MSTYKSRRRARRFWNSPFAYMIGRLADSVWFWAKPKVQWTAMVVTVFVLSILGSVKM